MEDRGLKGELDCRCTRFRHIWHFNTNKVANSPPPQVLSGGDNDKRSTGRAKTCRLAVACGKVPRKVVCDPGSVFLFPVQLLIRAQLQAVACFPASFPGHLIFRDSRLRSTYLPEPAPPFSQVDQSDLGPEPRLVPVTCFDTVLHSSAKVSQRRFFEACGTFQLQLWPGLLITERSTYSSLALPRLGCQGELPSLMRPSLPQRLWPLPDNLLGM